MALIADSVENRQSWRDHLSPPLITEFVTHSITSEITGAPCRTRSSHSIQAYAKLGSMSPSEVPAFPPSPHLGLWAVLAAILCRYSKMQGAHSTLELAVNDDFSFLHLSPESFHIFTSQFTHLEDMYGYTTCEPYIIMHMWMWTSICAFKPIYLNPSQILFRF